MQRGAICVSLVGFLALVGCGTKGGAPAHAPEGGTQASAAGAPESSKSSVAQSAADDSGGRGYGYSYENDSSSAESAAPPAAADRAAPAPRSSRPYEYERREERPGLATLWGETVSSRVHNVGFARDAESPFATAAIYYNDAAGVSAMVRSGGDHHPPAAYLYGGAIRVRLLDSNGNPLESFAANGRFYTIGEAGERYSVEMRNDTGERIEAVVTVDGLDVIDGQAGSFSKRGYLVGPWSTLQIDGFRQSQDSVAAFRFGRVSDSYAARKGKDRHVGIIGVAVFRERGHHMNDREIELRHSADPFPGRFAEPPPPRRVY